MFKAFELILKKGKVPVFSLPHIDPLILTKVQQCKKFRDYAEKLDHLEEGVQVEKVEILGVEMFGQNVGFINMRAVTQKDGFKLPSYIFLRGHAVGILMLVNSQLLLVEQYRVPTQQTMLEAPAGMIDESGDFIGVAAKQIQEETGIKITKESLKLLGSYYPSPGGCEEEMFVYLCKVEIPAEQLKVIQDKVHGEGDHERIRVKLVDYTTENVLRTKDSKLIYGSYVYNSLLQGKNVPHL